MKIYTKPSINVIELSIEENIAALIPKTVYKKKGSSLQANSAVEFKGKDELQFTSIANA